MSRPVRVRARCPACRRWQEWSGAAAACSSCGRPLERIEPLPAADRPIQRCAICAGQRFYRRRDFHRGWGLALVAGAAAVFLLLLALDQPYWLALAVLGGTAGLDALLYRWLPELTVCYRCAAEYRGGPLDPAHGPFDIHIAEEYR